MAGDEKSVEEQLKAFSDTLTELLKFEAADHERLVRVESMLVYLLSLQQEEVITQPTTEQAKQLVALGLPPWPRIKMATNHFELWKARFDERMKQKEAERAEATPEG